MEAVNGKLPIHPFMIRKSVETWINGKIDGGFPENQGLSYALKVRSKWQYDKLLAMDELHDGTKVKISKHVNHNTVRCVITCKDMVSIEDKDAMNYLNEQNITEIRRITRRSANGKDRENTPTVILTIDGTNVPEYVDVGYLRCKTRPYYPSPMLCFKCYSFGHTKTRCQQPQPTCGNCAKVHALVDGERCTDPTYCPRCKSQEHSVSSRKCPVYLREDAIQDIRIDKGITYPAARRLFEATNNPRSYAGTASASKDKAIADLTAKYDSLAYQMKIKLSEKDQIIAELQEQTKFNTTSNSYNEFQELRKMIQDLQREVHQKDERIKALETQTPSDRMDLTRKHGTIEDLVKRVQSLEDASAAKDRENETLRAENQEFRDYFRMHKLTLQSMTNTDKQKEATPNEDKKQPLQKLTGGAIKKKSATKQHSDENTPKRVKNDKETKAKSQTHQRTTCPSPVSISDSEENLQMDTELNEDTTIITNGDISSDELMDDQDPSNKQ